MKFNELNLLDLGNTIQLVGGVYSGNGTTYLCYFPGEDDGYPQERLDMDVEDWTKFLWQTDVLNVEALVQGADGTVAKAITRKSLRQIDNHVSWAAYKRDGYRCRYCGRDGPLTVDHIVLWEEGGPSTLENLLSSCRKCNKTRGNMPYAEWLKSPYYYQVSRPLPRHILIANEGVLQTTDQIKRVYVRSR